MARGNRPLPAAVLRQLCMDLGHDPNRVTEITLTKMLVTVTYAHRVTSGIEED